MDCRTAYSHNRSNIRFDSISDHQNLLRKYVQFPCHPAVIILALGRQHLYMMEIPVKPGFPEFCKLFDQITLGRYGQPVFSAGGKEGGPVGVGAMDQAVCGAGTGARAVGLPEKPQVFPEIGGGADCKVPG